MRSCKLFLFLLSFLCCNLVFAQGTQVEFGKNRVQYHDDFDEWSMYESINFITYWYGKGRFIGQAVVQMAEMDFESIQNILEHRMNDKIEIIVYTDITDLKQSNIGSEEAFVNTGGQTKIVGNKMFVYFDGNHNNLRRQVREGIASVYLNAMLFGSNLQEIVQNAVMMNLPEWFKQGLISYVGEDWNTELDDELRDALLSKTYKDFDDIAEEYPKLAGHALWYFISQNFGKSTVSNLLYLTRINRSIESGFLYVLGSTYRKTTENWMTYFTQRYKGEVKGMETPGEGNKVEIKNKRKLPLTQVKLSPNGQNIAYVTNEIGKTKIYLQNINTGERSLLFKHGFRNAFQETDYNYPLLAWKPNGLELSVIYERRDIIKLITFDVSTKELIATQDLDPQYDRIFSADYLNMNDLVFSGETGGFSDLFVYYPITRQTQRITNDFYDDLDASVIKYQGKTGILFVSNRQDTTLTRMRLDSILPIDRFDIYFYNFEEKAKTFVRITNTPSSDERNPIVVDSTYFSFLSDESGIFNRKMGFMKEEIAYYERVIALKEGGEIRINADSSMANIDTSAIDSMYIEPVFHTVAYTHNHSNYNRNIASHNAALRGNKIAEVLVQNGEYNVYLNTPDPTKQVNPRLTKYQQQQLRSNRPFLLSDRIQNEPSVAPITEPKEEVPADAPSVVIENEEKLQKEKDETERDYLFQSQFDDFDFPQGEDLQKEERVEDLPIPTTEILGQTALENQANQTLPKFRPARIVPYRLKFKTDYITTQLDNSLLFEGLDSYAGTGQEYTYPPPGILLKGNFKDLFEDFEVEGGIRVPTTFNGAEYFLIFDDKKKRLDKRYAFYRRNLRNSDDASSFILPRKTESTVLLGQYQLRYPLDIFRSIRTTFTLRNDKLTQLATDAVPFNTSSSTSPLTRPTVNEQRIGVKAEYVFDNTLDVSINIKNGTRYKVFAEVVKRFQVDIANNFDISFNDGIMTILGLDARHYQRLGKHSIIALRLAAATSFGSEKILYYLGGVDNWLFPKFNENIPLPQNDVFAYQTLAANMRGFSQNIRNGSSYALANTELRVPVFRYLSRRPIRNSFLRNFQAVGFLDVGTAWQGATPFSSENPLNIVTISSPNNPVTVRVNYFRDPIVAGYGVGARTVLFGYFIRVDYAWGIETGVVQDPRWYLSLGLDF